MNRTFDALARHHRRAIYVTARRHTTNAEDAEDLTQEALYLAYRHFHQFQPGTQFAAWVGRIVSRLAIRGYHQRARRPELEGVRSPPMGGARRRRSLDVGHRPGRASPGDDLRLAEPRAGQGGAARAPSRRKEMSDRDAAAEPIRGGRIRDRDGRAVRRPGGCL
jgi:RNA polymerase sigma factor (sigma-70 family)